MTAFWISTILSTVCLLLALGIKRRSNNLILARHSITPEALNELMRSNHQMVLFDLRRPLDLLSDSEIIPGSRWISPKELLEGTSLLPANVDVVVYFTGQSDAVARRVMRKAFRLGFPQIKLLRGGLPAWKANGYAVVKYEKPFRLDTKA